MGKDISPHRNARPPHVVLVTVGGDAADDAVGVLLRYEKSGGTRSMPGILEIREHDAAVDEHDLASTDAGTVAADLSKASEKRDLDGV